MSTHPVIEPSRLAALARDALEDGKGVDIRVLDVHTMTVITDYMIVATGRSSRQVKALADRVREAVVAHKAEGASVVGIEGEAQAEWVLIDLGDVIVHVMQPETREFYQLEKLWEERPRAQADAG
jgi:ribosome-associated protein